MKLKSDYVLYEPREGETLAVATGEETKNFSGILRANASGGFILNCLKEEITEEEILEKLKQEYMAEESVLKNDLEKILEKLREIGALEE